MATLRRKTEDMHSLMALLGHLNCMAQPVRLSSWYRRAGYKMLTDLPAHPLLRKPMCEPHRLQYYNALHTRTHYEEEVKVRPTRVEGGRRYTALHAFRAFSGPICHC